MPFCDLVSLTPILLALAATSAVGEDLVVSGATVVIDSPRTVAGEVIVEKGGTLVVRNTTLTLALDYDEHHHIDLAGNSRLVVENGVITSTGGQYWIELYPDASGSPMMEVSGTSSRITNHSGIRPFGATTIRVTGGDVEELQVRERTVVEVSNAATYPVFFFDGINADIPRLDTGTSVTNQIATAGGWSFSLTNAHVEGYQIDLKNGARVMLANGDGIVLSLHTPGTLGDELRIVENVTRAEPSSGSVTNLGTQFHFVNSNVALVNVYVFGTDRVLLRGIHVNEVNAGGASELVIGQKGVATRLNCNLCQVYDDASFTVVDATIDAESNLPSATAAFASAVPVGSGVMSFANMDLRQLDLTAINHGVMNVYNCTVDQTRLRVLDTTAKVNQGSLRADLTATRLSGTAPLSVGFFDLSAGNISSWSWDFGDGATAAQQAPTHVYTKAGTYSVSLTVTGASGTDTRVREGWIKVTGGGRRRRAVRH